MFSKKLMIELQDHMKAGKILKGNQKKSLPWGMDEFHHLVKTFPLSPRFFTLLDKGENVNPRPRRPMPKHTPDNFEPELSRKEILKAMNSGRTVQLRNTQHFHPVLNKLQHNFMDEFKCYANINVYFTPAGKSGSKLHTDGYDLVVIQLMGSKRWTYLEGKKKKEVSLKKGDFLYLPAWTPHMAHSEKADSLHLTIGLHLLQNHGLLESIFRQDRSNFIVPEKGSIDTETVKNNLISMLKKVTNLSHDEMENHIVNYWHENLASTYTDFQEEEDLSFKTKKGEWKIKGLARELHPMSGKSKK